MEWKKPARGQGRLTMATKTTVCHGRLSVAKGYSREQAGPIADGPVRCQSNPRLHVDLR